uniref:Uncharacterized protein n=1 Tax=Caenorhabditis japonica TaxID=281687 RepID=A0A8R1IFW1_CAEJA
MLKFQPSSTLFCLIIIIILIILPIPKVSSFPLFLPRADHNVVDVEEDIGNSPDEMMVLRKNETRHERVLKLQHYFKEGDDSTWSWRDAVCSVFHAVSLFPPNCYRDS